MKDAAAGENWKGEQANALPGLMLQPRPAAFASHDIEQAADKAHPAAFTRGRNPQSRSTPADDEPKAAIGRGAGRIYGGRRRRAAGVRMIMAENGGPASAGSFVCGEENCGGQFEMPGGISSDIGSRADFPDPAGLPEQQAANFSVVRCSKGHDLFQ